MSEDSLTWIKHDGGPMPVPGDAVLDVRLRCGEVTEGWPANDYDWSELGGQTIVEYAIVTPSPTRPQSALDVQEGGSHYKTMSIQPVEYMMANAIPFMEGCVIKYMTRWRSKGGLEDLRKARHFIDLLIENEEKPNG